jgi:excisionase family DNA binding protein
MSAWVGVGGIANDSSRRLAALEAQLAAQKDDKWAPAESRPPPAEDPSIRCYTVKEVAKILRSGLSVTYAAIEKGKIPAIKIGGRWLVPHDALVRLLATARQPTVT